ncbi:transposase [Methanocaldococcus jannaschii]|uniref:transposase n=1 Tax=Methanocaldococcus jannaschii TaxID=2190 RepID=UPI001FCB0951|nr:transposase [Methanocaldococcus jannaschii]
MTDGKYLMLLFINPANQHDKDILEENYKEIIRDFKNCVIIGDKGYIDKGLQNLFKLGGVYFIPIKRKNMIKPNEEAKKYKELNKLRKAIETNLSKLAESFPRHIRAVSKKGLSAKLLLFTIAYNIQHKRINK